MSIILATWVILIVIFTAYILVTPFEKGESEGGCYPHVDLIDDNYLIEFYWISDGADSEDIGWELLDSDGQVIEWVSPGGEVVKLEGTLADINYSQSDREMAHIIYAPAFYSRMPSGNASVSINQTLYIVFIDSHSNGEVDSQDFIWIRSTKNGGAVDDGVRLRLKNLKTGGYHFSEGIDLGCH